MAKVTIKKALITNFHKGETMSKTLVITTDALGLTIDDSFRLRIKKMGGTELAFTGSFAIYEDSGSLKCDIKLAPSDTAEWETGAYTYEFDLLIDNESEDSFMVDEREFKLLERIV